MVDAPAQAAHEPLARLYRWVLLAYVVLVTAFARDFARLELHVAGLPIFTAELTIVILAGLLVALSLRLRRVAVRFGLAGWLLLAFLAVASCFALVGLVRGFGLAAIRDFALVYYLVFFFFTLAFLQHGGTVVQLVAAMTAGAVVGAVVTVGEFLVSPALNWEHAAPGYVALTAWVAALWLAITLADRRAAVIRGAYLAAILVCTAAIYLSAYRTMAAVILAGTSVFVFFAWWLSRLRGLRAAIALAGWFLAGGLAVVAHGVATREGARSLPIHGPTTRVAGMRVVSARWAQGLELPGRTQVAVVEAVTESAMRGSATAPGIGGSSATKSKATGGEGPTPIPTPKFTVVPYPTNELVDSVGFRKLAWRNAMARIRNAPLTGMGFGPNAALFPDRFCELISSPLSNCGNAHNTYLTLAMRVGLPMFALFVLVNALILIRLLVTLGRRDGGRDAGVVPPFALAVLAGFAVYGLTSLFLESPYLSVLYWVVLGCISHLAAVAGAAQRSGPAAGDGALAEDSLP